MADSQYMSGRKKYSRPQAMLWSENSGILSNGFYIPAGYEVGAVVPEDTDGTLVDQFITLSDDNRAPLDFKIERLEQRERMINGRMRSYHIADKLTISTSWEMLPSRAFRELPNFGTDGKPGSNIVPASYRINTIPQTEQTTVEYSEPETVIVPQTNILDVNGNTVVIPRQSVVQPVHRIGATSLFTDPDGPAQTVQSEQFTTDGGAGGIELLDWYENHQGPFWVFLAYDKYTNFSDPATKYDNLNKYNQVVQMYISDFSYSVQKRGATNHDMWNISVTLEEV